MSWEECTLGELLKVKHGFAFKSAFFEESGSYVIMTPGNFHELGGFRARGEKDRSYSGEIPSGYILNKDDVVVAMTEQGPGLLGSSAIIPEDGKFLHNQRIGLIHEVDKNKADKNFLYYLFNTRSVRAQISGSATGTKVRHTAPERIYRVKVRLPGVDQQRTIADALRAYDNLIERNRRRIVLLEEAARLLYREWFIRLRFPGHEHANVVDGIPDGWSRQTLANFAVVRKGKNITKETVNYGTVPVVAGGLNPAYFHDTSNAKGPVITVSASGANSGYVNLYHSDIWASDCSYFSVNDNPEIFLLFCLLKSQQAEITAMQKGAAQPHVYPKDLERLTVLWPHEVMRAEFTQIVVSQFEQIKALLDQVSALSRARDLLLPRLMDGKIEV